MNATPLQITLFGKLIIKRGEQIVRSLDAYKLQELFCYLLLHRDRQHPRESLADRFWGEHSIAQARTRLRKSLWELQSAITCHQSDLQERVLLVDSSWVQVNLGGGFSLDVAVFEEVFESVRDLPGEALNERCVQQLQAATELYRGDLLEGWYQDWCLYERERLQQIYLLMLDKLMAYCEAQCLYEQGIAYGARILRYDSAQEQTHRRLMRLHFLAGNRTSALRQYERCTAALQAELGVAPTDYTTTLYAQIKANRLTEPTLPPNPAADTGMSRQLKDILARLEEVQTGLDALRQQVARDIQQVTQALEMHH